MLQNPIYLTEETIIVLSATQNLVQFRAHFCEDPPAQERHVRLT